MAKSSTYHKKNRNSKKRYGGINSSQWVSQVVGNYPHVAQGGSNVITNNVPPINNVSLMGGNGFPGSVSLIGGNGFPGSVSLMGGNGFPDSVSIPVPGSSVVPVIPNGLSEVSGGKKKRSNKRKGGDLVTELAVPAILLVANQTIGKKTGKKYAFPKKRFSKRRNTRFNRRR